MIDTAIIVQARVKSTRLPGKILLPFYQDVCCLELLLTRIQDRLPAPLFVATSDQSADDAIELLAARLNIPCYRGSEHNVLQRFIGCAQKSQIGQVVRVCSDNPFLDMDDLEKLVTLDMGDNEYVSFVIGATPSIRTHYGLWAEKIRTAALIKVQQHTQEPLYLEHVTNYIYANREKFKCHFVDRTFLVPNFPVRLTLDTSEDFTALSSIYAVLMERKMKVSIENIFQIIAENKVYQESMAAQIQQNSK